MERTCRSLLGVFAEGRRMAGLSQEELAERAGIARTNISRFETGAVSPTLDTMLRIAEALGKRLEIRLADRKEQE